MHTCYSPVRRSPAGDGKPSPPLPLDLHVLSLSLAFILSQDQTLRCCILFLFSFQNQKKGKTHYNVSAFADAARAARIVRPGCIPELLAVYCVLRIERSRSLRHAQLRSCTTLVYCNRFNVLCRPGERRPRFSRIRLQS